MRFSLLLPTRNRLTYLRHAVRSVMKQDFTDWEVIVSDNCSDEDIGGYVASLGDARVRYVRVPRFVPVTDNWNNALEHSRGEYVLMLGDDDSLLPGYLRAMDQRLSGGGAPPDVIRSGAYLFAYPGVMPDCRAGFVEAVPDRFVDGAAAERLDPTSARALVDRSLRFEPAFGFNMQYYLVARRFIESIADRGPFYQSLFPDFYAANVLMLRASVLIDPVRRVVIGVTPRSYGFFHYNNAERDGVELLAGDAAPEVREALRPTVLPGSHIYTGWLDAMGALRERFPEVGLVIDERRYRDLQQGYVARSCLVERALPLSRLTELWTALDRHERMQFALRRLPSSALRALVPPPLRRLVRAARRRLRPSTRQRLVGRFADASALYDHCDRQGTAALEAA